MNKKGQHVVPNNDGKWSVRRSGSTRASRVYDSLREAVQHARRIAQNQQTELYIHGFDGRIRERNSYGKDPHPPKG
jgi:Uncharacterized protein conserved in bacteria (DUF2188)